MNTRGFTLIELVVALVISAFLGGVIFQLLDGQQRFVGRQSAQEEVQQNGRAALELISGELRGASPHGIIAADSTSIEFRVPRVWGLVCDRVGGVSGAGGTSGTRAIAFATAGTAAFKTGSPPKDGLAVRDSLPGAPRWRFAPVIDATSTSGAAATASCNPLGPDAGRVQVRSLTLDAVPDTMPLQIGEPAYLFDVVAYDADVSNVPGKWLRRTDAGTPQPLAGPLAEENGIPVFRLRYFRANGTSIPVPVTAADLPTIARVDIKVKTISRSDDPQQEFTDSTRVYLRN